MPVKYPFPEDIFADDDKRDEALDLFATLPADKRERVFWALQVLIGTPSSEQLRFCEELAPRMTAKPSRGKGSSASPVK